MNITKPGNRIWLVMLIGLLMASWEAMAFDVDTHQSVGGMDIYIGIIPAEVIRNRKKENKMHGGTPHGKDRYHLVAALFDTKTATRISSAKVTANIAGLGLAGSTKYLEPMKINGVVTFGNYFILPETIPFYIRLKLDVPGKGVTEALFESTDTVR